MASRSRKSVRFAECAYERFIGFAPSDEEVDAVCEALVDVAAGSGHWFPVLGTGASGGALLRVDVGRFAVLYETSDIVHVVEVYIP